MVDLRRRRFFGKAATAAQIAAIALAVPAVVQGAVAPQAELDGLIARWTAVYPQLDEEGQELVRGVLQSHVVIFEKIASRLG